MHHFYVDGVSVGRLICVYVIDFGSKTNTNNLVNLHDDLRSFY